MTLVSFHSKLHELFIYIAIFSIILSWNIIEKTHLATWGLERTCGLSQEICYALDHHASQMYDGLEYSMSVD